MTAGAWIKIETDLPSKPEVLRLARLLGVHKSAAVGGLVVFWSWCDTHLATGELDVDPETAELIIDDAVGIEGFAKALEQVGWLTLLDSGAVVPHYERHMSKNAKRRAQESKRQAGRRSQPEEQSEDPAPVRKVSRSRHAPCVQTAYLEQEQEQEQDDAAADGGGDRGGGSGLSLLEVVNDEGVASAIALREWGRPTDDPERVQALAEYVRTARHAKNPPGLFRALLRKREWPPDEFVREFREGRRAAKRVKRTIQRVRAEAAS